MNNMIEAIAYLDQISSHNGLPEPLFLFISRTTPLVNVDLLIKDENKRTLLAWRDDPYVGTGWHIPGGILRLKEKLVERVKKVIETEIEGANVKYDELPVAMNELIIPNRDSRSHFVAFLYECHLGGNFVPQNKFLSLNNAGYLQWHNGCPSNLIKSQEVYRKLI